MRVLRAKHVRKCLQFYRIVFGINAPFHVLLDGNFIFHAIKYKVDIRLRVEKLLQETGVKLYVLRSVIAELEAVGSNAASSLQFANAYCTIIEDSSISGTTTIEKLLGLLGEQGQNRGPSSKIRKYFVASQDEELRAVLGSKPGVPLMYLNKVTLVLEPPSNYSKEASTKIEQDKTALNEEEATIVKSLNKKRKRDKTLTPELSVTSAALLQDGAGVAEVTGAERKKHKAKQPNPMSVKPASKDSKTAKKKKQGSYNK